MELNLEAKKTLLRKIPHGLFICTVREGDEINGFTASWVTQGSFVPPLVVMAVRADGSSHGMINRTKKFCLNVLRSDQKELAAIFFKPQKGLGGRFESTVYTFGKNGLPVLEDGIGGLECNVINSIEHGDHTDFVAEVVSALVHNDTNPLILSDTGWSYGG